MHRLGVFMAVIGLAVLANVGFSSDGMASTHGHVAGSTGQLADALVGPGGGNIGVTMESMDPARGRKLFASKGCVICHSVNGVGGEDAPPLDAENMPSPMNPFDFAASMWRGAEAMIAVQQDELGEQIEFTGAELADIIAFIHDPVEQKKFSEEDAPLGIRVLLRRMHEEENGEQEADKPKE